MSILDEINKDLEEMGIPGGDTIEESMDKLGNAIANNMRIVIKANLKTGESNKYELTDGLTIKNVFDYIAAGRDVELHCINNYGEAIVLRSCQINREVCFLSSGFGPNFPNNKGFAYAVVADDPDGGNVITLSYGVTRD